MVRRLQSDKWQLSVAMAFNRPGQGWPGRSGVRSQPARSGWWPDRSTIHLQAGRAVLEFGQSRHRPVVAGTDLATGTAQQPGVLA